MATKAEIQKFLDTIVPLAQKEYLRRNKWVLPSICIAQAACETGWGTSGLMVKANAFFGIKAGSSWKGKVYSAKTNECYDGVSYTEITDTFRAYDSPAESVKDYFDLITGASRYSGAVCNSDPKSTIQAIKDGGYATSPTYVSTIMSIVDGGQKLRQYDIDHSTGTVEEGADSGPDKSNGNGQATTNYNGSESQGLQAIGCIKLAEMVINGSLGNGEDRKRILGDRYPYVQDIVNHKLTGSNLHSSTIDTLAKEVINGKYGNGDVRKKKLGNLYTLVQNRVNNIY